MIDIEVSHKLNDILDNCVVLGYIKAKVEVKKSEINLLNEINEICKDIEEKYELEDVLNIENINALRNAYKTLGKDPSRYRLSSEAQLPILLDAC